VTQDSPTGPGWRAVVLIHQRGRVEEITGEVGDVITVESSGQVYQGTIVRIDGETVALRLGDSI
jgi:ribosomal protein L35AE/L33A